MSEKEWLERNVWKSKPNNYEPQLQILVSAYLTLLYLLWVSEEAENISLNNINWSTFITEMENVYKVKRIELWFIFIFKLLKSNSILQGNNTTKGVIFL
jgi:hypothetical protein